MSAAVLDMFHVNTHGRCSWSSIVKLNKRNSRNACSHTLNVLQFYWNTDCFLLKTRGWIQAGIEINYTVRNTYICVINLGQTR